jgi:purine-binding chemotaxis protein CheW
MLALTLEKNAESMEWLLLFEVAGRRFALSAGTVERVERARETVPLPGAPEVVSGVVCVHGEPVPVLDLRRRFRMVPREVEPSDALLLVRAGNRTIGIVADAVLDVVALPAERVWAAGQGAAAVPRAEGVVELGEGVALIHDLARFLTFEEGALLDGALDRR